MARKEKNDILKFQDVRSRPVCLRIIPRLRNICQRWPFDERHHMQLLVADFDRDGRTDVMVRYQSLVSCGTHGCTIELYRGMRNGRFVDARLNVVSHGDVKRCRASGKPGVSFTTRGELRHCFAIS
jgi:hypothetical protein